MIASNAHACPPFRSSTFPFERRSSGSAIQFRASKGRSSGTPRREPLHAHFAEPPERAVNWYQLEGALAYGFRLAQPILVKVTSHSDGTSIVTDDFSSVYGAGDSSEAAILDYRQSLAESYEILMDDYESLGPNLQNELNRLLAYVSQVSNAA